MDRFPHVTELTFDCSNTVTLAASHDKNVRAALWGEQEDERAVLISDAPAQCDLTRSLTASPISDT